MHLAFDQRIHLVTARLLLPYEAQGVPVSLQRTGRTQAVLALPQKPVEEGVQDIDRDAFESGYRVLFSKLAVSGGIDQTLIDLLGGRGRVLTGTKTS